MTKRHRHALAVDFVGAGREQVIAAIVERMQATLDRLAAERRLPVLG